MDSRKAGKGGVTNASSRVSRGTVKQPAKPAAAAAKSSNGAASGPRAAKRKTAGVPVSTTDALALPGVSDASLDVAHADDMDVSDDEQQVFGDDGHDMRAVAQSVEKAEAPSVDTAESSSKSDFLSQENDDSDALASEDEDEMAGSASSDPDADLANVHGRAAKTGAADSDDSSDISELDAEADDSDDDSSVGSDDLEPVASASPTQSAPVQQKGAASKGTLSKSAPKIVVKPEVAVKRESAITGSVKQSGRPVVKAEAQTPKVKREATASKSPAIPLPSDQDIERAFAAAYAEADAARRKEKVQALIEEYRRNNWLNPEGLPSIANLAEIEDEDEEGDRNRIGAVPLEWYNEYDHIGYDVYGKKIVRQVKGDQLDEFIARKDDPNKWRTVYDAVNDRNIVLSDAEVTILNRIRKGQFPDPTFDAFPEFDDLFTSEKRIEALGNAIEPKRRFVPSKWEAKKVAKLVNAIRNGWIKDPEEVARMNKKPEVYSLWTVEAQTEEERKRSKLPPHIPAPKLKLPVHAESYNPPAEYLPTQEELDAWEAMDPEDRPYNFLPQKFDSMRQIPLYGDFIKERFERCLDLYLCPRTRRKKLNIDPESLIPQLPKPQDLRPFPTTLTVEYIGHTEKVRSISVSPDGQWIATGSDDFTVRVWEVDSGRMFKLWYMGGIVDFVAWNPNPAVPLLAVACKTRLWLLHTHTGTEEQTQQAETMLKSFEPPAPGADQKQHATWSVVPESDASDAVWREQDMAAGPTIRSSSADGSEAGTGTDQEAASGAVADRKIARLKVNMMGWINDAAANSTGQALSLSRICIEVTKRIKQITWHHKGDYLSTVSLEANQSLVLIHRVSKNQTTCPFSKTKGQVQRVLFHPEKPIFFVATQNNIRIYNLAKSQLMKKLLSPMRWISSMHLHPTGDHLVVGSYDRRVCWYDLDLSDKPYKTLKYHDKAVRGVNFHRSFPLMASCSDDGKLHVFHGMVYSDLLTNALIVPVKIINAHKPVSELGVLDCAFHPTQPWIFSAGADKAVRLFT